MTIVLYLATAGYGGREFSDDMRNELIKTFLDRRLMP